MYPLIVSYSLSYNSVLNYRQFKGGYPVLRSVPSRKCTRGEAHRLIDVATKILVATVSIKHSILFILIFL